MGLRSPDKSYIITGGLGGFGMAVAEFLNWHGAKNIVVTSKRGVRNGSQLASLQELWFSKINVRTLLRHVVADMHCDRISQWAHATPSACQQQAKLMQL